jgi:hypothetical protein
MTEQKEEEFNEAERIPEEKIRELWRRVFDKIEYPRDFTIIAYVLKPEEYELACRYYHKGSFNAVAFVIYDKKNKKYRIFLQQNYELLDFIHELVHVYNFELFGDGVEELELRKGGGNE